MTSFTASPLPFQAYVVFRLMLEPQPEQNMP